LPDDDLLDLPDKGEASSQIHSPDEDALADLVADLEDLPEKLGALDTLGIWLGIEDVLG
jgi:hypothetical protein